jgi:hypothetical protein
MTPDGGEESAERGRSAARRIEELEERRKRLQAGEAPTLEDAAQARAAADRGQLRNERAAESAKLARERAASRHREAAKLLDRAGHSDRAEEHRQAASDDEDAAEEESSTSPASSQTTASFRTRRRVPSRPRRLALPGVHPPYLPAGSGAAAGRRFRPPAALRPAARA